MSGSVASWLGLASSVVAAIGAVWAARISANTRLRQEQELKPKLEEIHREVNGKNSALNEENLRLRTELRQRRATDRQDPAS